MYVCVYCFVGLDLDLHCRYFLFQTRHYASTKEMASSTVKETDTEESVSLVCLSVCLRSGPKVDLSNIVHVLPIFGGDY